MTVRNPLYVSGGNLIAMSTGDIEQYRQKAIFLYSQAPSAVLTVVSGSGALISAIDDTRTKAGAASQSASAFVYADSTAEPATVTVSYDKVNLAYTSTGAINETADTGTSFPVYYDNDTNAIRSMNLTDFLDTFIYPAIINLSSSTESAATAGTYTVTTSATAASNYTQVSSTAIFADTRANTGAYSAAGIPETLDQPTTITSYFLHRRNGADSTPSRNLLLAEGGTGGLIEGATATMKTLIGDWIRYDTANTSGQKIIYTMATSGGNTRGSGVVDTKLNGSGNYKTLEAYTTAYRSQEFPDGSPVTVATYALRIAKGG